VNLPLWGRCGGGFTFETPSLTLPEGREIAMLASLCGGGLEGVIQDPHPSPPQRGGNPVGLSRRGRSGVRNPHPDPARGEGT